MNVKLFNFSLISFAIGLAMATTNPTTNLICAGLCVLLALILGDGFIVPSFLCAWRRPERDRSKTPDA